MRKYHLSCGDSSRGPVGLCGTVLAPTKGKRSLFFAARSRTVRERLEKFPFKQGSPESSTSTCTSPLATSESRKSMLKVCR